MGIKRKITVFTVMILMAGMLAGCADASQKDAQKPDVEHIRNICKLATVQCYYHNVAMTEKKASNIFEKDKDLWIEYTGVANLGIDMSQVNMKINGTNVKVTIPDAEVLNVSVDKNSLSYTTSRDGLFKNKITAEEQSETVKKAQAEMKKTVNKNSDLLMRAQDRAKKLIENYVNQLGDATGTEYQIEWEYCK